MAIMTYRREEQSAGMHGNLDLHERKPVGFYKDAGLLSPYSNIFYWSHMSSGSGADTGEHSHKGFEILSFVLNGEIEHYDNRYRGWKRLSAGDMQVIMAGNGYVHSERFLPASSVLQIWFDPDLEKTLNRPSSYSDFPSDRFPIRIEEGRSTKVYVGEGSGAVIHTPGVTISEISLAEGKHACNFPGNVFISGFILEGHLNLRGSDLGQYDFFIAKEEEKLEMNAKSDCRLFVVESPVDSGYPTYAGDYRM
ncbi:MAG: hypothetical protein EA408_02350 [Marinilabiliales bacterium]|nr:MAG: hypothetical protein EA408_02350 [Marinilabiliales bacterium]